MNRGYLILGLLFTILLFAMKNYFDTKEEVLSEYQRFIKLEDKIKQINALEEKYNYKNRLNQLKRFCKISENDKIIITCNLNKNRFSSVSNLLFRGNFKLSKFDIEKNKTITIRAELIK